ncbi:MAG: hypothetical protein ACTSW2_06570 [Alphaproteobacteria bacterium]
MKTLQRAVFGHLAVVIGFAAIFAAPLSAWAGGDGGLRIATPSIQYSPDEEEDNGSSRPESFEMLSPTVASFYFGQVPVSEDESSVPLTIGDGPTLSLTSFFFGPVPNSEDDSSEALMIGIRRDLSLGTGPAPSSRPQQGMSFGRRDLPLSIGFEAEATSWLTLRGSVRQSVFTPPATPQSGQAKDKFRTWTNTKILEALYDEGLLTRAQIYRKLAISAPVNEAVEQSLGDNGYNEQRLKFGTDSASDNGQFDSVLDTGELLNRVGIHYWF